MTCPFIDTANPHCSASLNMRNLDDAFELCNDQYKLCPLYVQLAQLQAEPVLAAVGMSEEKYV